MREVSFFISFPALVMPVPFFFSFVRNLCFCYLCICVLQSLSDAFQFSNSTVQELRAKRVE